MSILFGSKSYTIIRGTGWRDNVTLTNSDTGDAVDLTNITDLVMRIREDINGPILLELSLNRTGSAGRLEIVDGAAGVFGFRLTTADSLLLPENDNAPAKYVFDTVIERSAGEYEPGIGGKLTVKPQITRAYGST